MSPLQQIRENAAWVAENLGRQSGVDPFAYTAESVEYLDRFLEGQQAQVKASALSVNKFVHLLGAYLGECIIAVYGGEWQESPEGLAVVIRAATQSRHLQPFHEVYERIAHGREGQLATYFSEFIPQALSL